MAQSSAQLFLVVVLVVLVVLVVVVAVVAVVVVVVVVVVAVAASVAAVAVAVAGGGTALGGGPVSFFTSFRVCSKERRSVATLTAGRRG